MSIVLRCPGLRSGVFWGVIKQVRDSGGPHV